MLFYEDKSKNPDNMTFIFQLQDNLSLGSTDSLSVDSKVRFGKAFFHYEQIFNRSHVFQEAGGTFAGLFKKKKSYGAETGSQIAASYLFLYQTSQLSGKGKCINEQISSVCHFEDDLSPARELSGSSDNLTKNNNKVISYCFYQSV